MLKVCASAKPPSGAIGKAKRSAPNWPILMTMPASTTDPAVGASPWARGSHECTGTNGTLTAKPPMMARNTHHCVEAGSDWPYWISVEMLKSIGVPWSMALPAAR